MSESNGERLSVEQVRAIFDASPFTAFLGLRVLALGGSLCGIGRVRRAGEIKADWSRSNTAPMLARLSGFAVVTRVKWLILETAIALCALV